jgi:hypothetical protein
LAILLMALPAAAGDLTKIDRTIAKEPAYQSRPEYCLLVVGPQGKDRVWLVIDGDTLYVDRNGNGDLTEKDARVEAIKIQDNRMFLAGTIRPGGREYTDLTVSRNRLNEGAAPLQPEHYQKLIQANPEAYAYGVSVRLENPLQTTRAGGADRMTQCASSDSRGILEFGTSPQDAPVVYFDGPWTMDLHNRQYMFSGNVFNFESGVGTRGLGPGTFAFIVHDSIPKRVHPQAEFEFPAKAPGAGPIRVKYEILERC